MNREALAWASNQKPSKGRAKEVLRLRAGFANADGETWSPVSWLAEQMQLSERQIQRLDRVLVADGLMTPTGRFHKGKFPIHQLALHLPGALAKFRGARCAAKQTSTAFAKGDVDVASHAAKGDIGDARRATPVSPDIKGDINSGADAPEKRAREADQLIDDWARVSPGRVSPVRARAAFLASTERYPPARLLAAGRRYLAEDADVRRLGTALSLHSWLIEERFIPWIDKPPPLPARWRGPPVIRDTLVNHHGEDWVGSWLDHCSWEADRSAILTRTTLGAEQLQRALRAAIWRELGVLVIEKG